MIILKFGGTSVGSAENIKKVVEIITKIEAPKIIVLSAVTGTTNSLIEIGSHARNNSKELAFKSHQLLNDSYQELINELYATPIYKEKAIDFVSSVFENIGKDIENEERRNIENMIVAQGEIISTNLMQLYLEESSISSSLVSAFEFMEIDENSEPKINVITEKLIPLLNKEPLQNTWITQGFICMNSSGEIANLQRGGSDYTASLIGAGIKATEIQIWTDIDGMHNNDPRYVENTFSIEEISFDEAAELAYFGAKILYPQSLIPAKENNIPVLLKNTFSPGSKGTIIKNTTVTDGVTAIAAKDGITAIKIKSYRMLMAYGFLKKVFEIFEKYQTPIDMITTSEVAVSITIDTVSFLKEITEELEKLGSVVVDSDLSIICIAGDFSQENENVSAAIFNSLKGIPIRMISYGGSNYNISLLVKKVDKIAALNSLNRGLFN
jgi:aspartate kinase